MTRVFSIGILALLSYWTIKGIDLPIDNQKTIIQESKTKSIQEYDTRFLSSGMTPKIISKQDTSDKIGNPFFPKGKSKKVVKVAKKYRAPAAPFVNPLTEYVLKGTVVGKNAMLRTSSGGVKMIRVGQELEGMILTKATKRTALFKSIKGPRGQVEMVVK